MKFLDKNWLDSHFRQVKNKAKNRYTPKLNIDLPISEAFDGIGRTKNFYYSIRTHFGKLKREFRNVSSKYDSKKVQRLYNGYSKLIFELLCILEKVKEYDTKVIPWWEIEILAKKANELSWKLSDNLQEEKVKSEKQKLPENHADHQATRSKSEIFGSDIRHIYEAQKELRYFERFSNSTSAKLSNKPFFILTGLAGTGKTHLLCDLVENRLKGPTGSPSLLVFGEFFDKEDNLWNQVAIQLGLNNSYNKGKILKLLNNIGKRRGVRSLLIIDALNETSSLRFWKNNLNKLYEEIRKYPHLALIISIRSGFENEVLTKKVKKYFVQEEHRGFQFREWEAVTKFFKEFSLPLPEIPLLMPEFQNPLFLLLFCKAFHNRSNKKGGKKQIFRGHEGATYIFENFVDSVSKKIAKQFNIDNGAGKNIWDKVIEPVAAEMVNLNNDRISEDKLLNVVTIAYPAIDHSKLLKELENNLLLIKVPHYSGSHESQVGFDYRFPFQKFSDHLVGRFIFKKVRSLKIDPKQFFAKNTHIGEFLERNWNIGIIEALCIQCPEQLKGTEFFEVAPYIDDQRMIEAFTQSLVWRRPNAFAKDLKENLRFINTRVIRSNPGNTNLLNAFLAVAPVPEHPFNAQFLHKHLANIKMPKRDSSWSTFLHYQYGERRAVDRLIEWGWSDQNKTHINDESTKLCSIALVWFLTTSNRFLRDRATKALVALLTDRLAVIHELVEQFKNVDDSYVIERLYAVAYGCALRNAGDKQGLNNLAQWFYDNVFKSGKPPVNILIRDYARGVIEVAIQRGLMQFDTLKIKPPYRSTWPTVIPSEKELREKYYPEDFFKDKTKERGYLSVWSSVMHNFGSLADFGKYEVNSALDYWSGRRLGSGQISKNKQFELFKKSLTKKQMALLNKSNPFFGIKMSDILKYINSKKTVQVDEEKIKAQEKEAESRRQEAVKAFKNSLSVSKRNYYKQEIQPYLTGGSRINDPLERFDGGLGQRWIFNRVVQLGWNPKLHGDFDENLGYHQIDRREHKAERIGKKYQWIALHELLALVADNFEFKADRWSDTPGQYEGPWQLSIRDIDPSCTLREYPRENCPDIPDFTKPLPDYYAWKKRVTHSTWLKTTEDLPDPKQIIQIFDEQNIEWVVLEGDVEWQEETPPEQEKYNLPRRRLWYIFRSYLIKRKDTKKVYDWIVNKGYGTWMPVSDEFYNIFLGEYPTFPGFLYHYVPYYHHDGWTDGGSGKIPGEVLVSDDQYLSSGSSIDCSTDETIRVKLPAKWVVDEMKLVQKYTDGRFYDKDDHLVAFDSRIFTKEPHRRLIFRKDALCKFLKDKELDIVWTLIGEKGTIGGSASGQAFGLLEISGAYRLDQDNTVTGQMKTKFIRKI